MTYADLVKTYGSAAAAARALGFSGRQTVHRWKESGIPEMAQLEIHRRTAGKLKADAPVLSKYRDILRAA